VDGTDIWHGLHERPLLSGILEKSHVLPFCGAGALLGAATGSVLVERGNPQVLADFPSELIFDLRMAGY
jgi:hypothetical protein